MVLAPGVCRLYPPHYVASSSRGAARQTHQSYRYCAGDIVLSRNT